MFTLQQIKFPPIAGIILAATFAMTGCGQTPAAVSANTQSQTVQAQTRYDMHAIETAIRSQIEKRIPDLTIRLSNIKIAVPATIDIYPPPPVSFLTFTADEQIIGFAGIAQYYQISGTYALKTGKVTVTSTRPMPIK